MRRLRVGDRVRHKYEKLGEGVIIGHLCDNPEMLLVEFDNPLDGHDGLGKSNVVGKDGHCLFSRGSQLQLVTNSLPVFLLKNGQIARVRNGDMYLVLITPDRARLVNLEKDTEYGWLYLSIYDQQLKATNGAKDGDEFDIMAVYEGGNSLQNLRRPDEANLLWERGSYKCMTHAEIEKELGYSFVYKA